MINLFNKTLLRPWEGRLSIYEAIKQQIGENGKINDDNLPDDVEFWDVKSVRWIAGGLDGVLRHHSTSDQFIKVKHIFQLLLKLSRNPSEKLRRKLYYKLMNENTLSIVDDVLELIKGNSQINYETLYNEAYWLAEKGAHRNVVKFGIALLGIFQTSRHLELIFTLGKHEEFTLYSSVAIQNSISDSNQCLFELAKYVDGWGKISVVEHLKADSQEIKNWLLREGYQNSIMYEYLAFTCALNGNLHKALCSEHIDIGLYNSAGDIISALISGGPAEDIDDYEYSPTVIGEFLRHSETMCQTVENLNVVLDIFQFLQEDDNWDERYLKGWTKIQREKFYFACEKIIELDKWEDLIWEGIKSKDSRVSWSSKTAARVLKIDIWEELFTQLKETPISSSLYFELMRTNDVERIKKLVGFAEENLPLDEIGTGPKDELGLGNNFEPHSCLDFILQDLNNYKGIGSKVVHTGLKSPVIRNRNMALNVLEEWPITSWDISLKTELNILSKVEPDNETRDRIAKLLISKGIK